MNLHLGKSTLHAICLLMFASFPGLCIAQHSIVLSGTVRDEVGKPIASAHITVRSAQNGPNAEAVTGADGSYSLSDLNAGTYLVTATAAGFATAHTEVTLTGSGKPTLDLTLAHADAQQQELANAPSANAPSATAPSANERPEAGLQSATDASQSRAPGRAR